MSFGKDLSRFRGHVNDRYTAVRKRSAFDLFGSIIMGTPVRFGVLRANWFVSIGAKSTEVTDAMDVDGAGTLQKTKNAISLATPTDDIFFTNSLAYAVPIEFDGASPQAPRGMVRVNVLRWNLIVDNVARELNRGR